MSRPRPLRVAFLILVVLLQGLGNAWALVPMPGMAAMHGHAAAPSVAGAAITSSIPADALATAQAPHRVAASVPAPPPTTPAAMPCHEGMAMPEGMVMDDAGAASELVARADAAVQEAVVSPADHAAPAAGGVGAHRDGGADDDARSDHTTGHAGGTMPCCDTGQCHCSAWCFGAAGAFLSSGFGAMAFGHAAVPDTATSVAALSPAHRRGLLRPPAALAS